MTMAKPAVVIRETLSISEIFFDHGHNEKIIFLNDHPRNHLHLFGPSYEDNDFHI